MSQTVVLRPAGTDEQATVRRLSYLDSSRPLRGEVMLGYVGEQAVAAVSLRDGRVVADPFVHSADVVEMLRAYAEGVRAGRANRHRARGVRRPRLGFAQ